MGLHSKIDVYMEEWGFRIVPKGEQNVSGDEMDDVTMEDIKQFKQADDEMDWFESELYKSLTDRVYFEHDVNNEVVTTFMDAIIKHWRSHYEWEEMVYFVDMVKAGTYDDEMKRYYTYLQAELLRDNLYLINFRDEDNIEDSLLKHGITVYDDDLVFNVAGVIESVERKYGLRVDVKRLLARVLRSLKGTGETINFKEGY